MLENVLCADRDLGGGLDNTATTTTTTTVTTVTSTTISCTRGK